jgi:hypothetical protein
VARVKRSRGSSLQRPCQERRLPGVCENRSAAHLMVRATYGGAVRSASREQLRVIRHVLPNHAG